TRKGDVLSRFRNIESKPLIQFADRDARVDADGTVNVRSDGIDFDVVLVLNFPDDLLDQILESHDTFNSTMLIHDDSEMSLRVLKQTDGVVKPRSVRNEHRLSQQLRQPERLWVMQVRHQVLAVQNAGNVVQNPVIDRKS